MRSLDTNVLARWMLGDDPPQTAIAASLLKETVWISMTVMLELGWVLSKSVGLDRETVAEMLQQLVDLDTAVVEHRTDVAWAIGRFRSGADWGDMMHLAASSADADAFVTFDRTLKRKAGSDSPIPVETLRA